MILLDEHELVGIYIKWLINDLKLVLFLLIARVIIKKYVSFICSYIDLLMINIPQESFVYDLCRNSS